METKSLVWIGLTIGSIVGSGLGSLMDNGNYFGVWGIVLGALGGIAGIWAGYKIGNN
jgi:hypothetical protein